jgi:TatD DNase family protein
MLVDTHCHLTADRYDADRNQVLARAREAGVGAVVVVASDLEDAEAARVLAEGGTSSVPAAAGSLPGTHHPGTGPSLHPTAGIHPHRSGEVGLEAEEHLRRALERPGIVAVGECGLDFHYDFSPREAQLRWFQAQLRLAAETGLPAVVHCREAEDSMIPLVREAGEEGIRGVLHCFPGHMGLLEAAMDAGWSVSFTGIVTFRNFGGEDAVRTVPGGRYFLETDGPYLAPAPHRGKRNEPAFLPRILERVAELRREAPDRVAEETTRAARSFFRLPVA